MHPNRIFRGVSPEVSVEFARERGFGTLIAHAPEGVLISHVPFFLSPDGEVVELHLSRQGPIACLQGAVEVTLVVNGPDGYVSPDWYGVSNEVPTWNYVAVHLGGVLERLDQAELLPLLERMSDFFEERLAPKPVWKVGKLTAARREALLSRIVPFRILVSRVESTWKLGQNKPRALREGAAAGVELSGGDSELAVLMRDLEESV